MSRASATICSMLRISTSACGAPPRRPGPGIRRSNDCSVQRLVGRTPLPRVRCGSHSRPPDRRAASRCEQPSRRIERERDAVGVGHSAALLHHARSVRSALLRHPGLRVAAAEPETSGAPPTACAPRPAPAGRLRPPRRHRAAGTRATSPSRWPADEVRRAAGACGCSSHGRTIRSRIIGATKTIGESGGSRLPGLADQPVDFLQTQRLQTSRQFAAQLIQRVAPLRGRAPLGQLVLLPDHANHQHDHRRGRNQDGRQQKSRCGAAAGGDPRDSRPAF